LDYRRENGTRIAPCLFTAPETIRQTGRRGCSIVFQPAYDVPEDVQQANSSPAFAAFQALTRNARLGNLPRNLGKQECTALEGIGDIATVLSNRLKQQILGRSDVKYIDLHIEAEQSPNPDSRVTLTDELDPLGMRRIALDWRIAPDDRQSVYETLMSLARGVGAASFGRLVMSMQNDNDTSMIGTSFHHMGTTRMHDDPKRGVVDRNCRVHGIENLYLAGSSVFPTAGRVNPTLTIVALAVRLAAYLKMQVRV
jgi:choline dehydrogenase-like flavoprotein